MINNKKRNSLFDFDLVSALKVKLRLLASFEWKRGSLKLFCDLYCLRLNLLHKLVQQVCNIFIALASPLSAASEQYGLNLCKFEGFHQAIVLDTTGYALQIALFLFKKLSFCELSAHKSHYNKYQFSVQHLLLCLI